MNLEIGPVAIHEARNGMVLLNCLSPLRRTEISDSLKLFINLYDYEIKKKVICW